jgi:hypothetical protein
MAHFRLFFVFAAMAALGYFAFRQGWVHLSFSAAPTPQPTLGFEVRPRKRTRRFAHTNRSLEQELAARGWGRMRKGHNTAELAPNPSSTALAALRIPGHNALEIGPASAPTASPVPGPKAAFPSTFEGCWQAQVDQPDDWSFNQGPVVKGWSPSTYVLCFRHSGGAPQVSFSTTAEYPVISEWVVSQTGGESSSTQILFSGDDFVVLRTSSTVPLHMKILGLLPGPTGIISSTADFHCSYQGPDRLWVEASVTRRCSNASTIDCDGNVWIHESWHREFTRQ